MACSVKYTIVKIILRYEGASTTEVPMSSLALDAVPSRSRHAQIRQLSRLFAWLFAGISALYSAFVLMLIAGFLIENPYVYFWPGGGVLELSGVPPELPGIVQASALPLWHRLFAVFCLIGMFAPGLMASLNVHGLFRLYAAGTVFAAGNALRFRHIGIWLMAFAVAPGIGQLAMRLTETAIDRNWFHAWEVHALILGGLLFVISLVMEVGREIEQERAEFV